MANPLLKLAPEFEGKSKEELLPLMDAELDRFSDYMAHLNSPGAGALINPERVLIKTFMVFLAKGKS